jgi:serine/threonine protein kinase
MEKIGAGNFSSVYRGVEKSSAKEVAVKVIEKFRLSENEKEVIKFEKGILELCHHPNIIRFFGDYNTKTRIYIVTELLTDGDLFEYTKKSTFLEEHEAAIIFKQLVEAIKYLNIELGLIHRDLKPENVLVLLNKEKTLIQRVKLIDFGFAVYKSNLKNLSDQEKFAGTPGFVAPEIFMGEEYD